MTRPRCGALSALIWAWAAAPDETTILRVRHLMEEHDLGGAMLAIRDIEIPSAKLRRKRRT
jgi:hypothetical protein